MAKPILHRNLFRNTSKVQTTSQLILQGSITRLANAEADNRDLMELRRKQAMLDKLAILDAIVDNPIAMETFIAGCQKMVDKLMAEQHCPDLEGIQRFDIT